MNTSLVSLQAGARALQIEYAFVGSAATDAPWLVILHEGLGSVAMWRDFPERLCSACGVRGLVYSRVGYGRSTPRAAAEHWTPDFMHCEARDVLPALLNALGAPPRYAILGHSDGASIGLIHAAAFPERVRKLVVLAPHILVEDVSVASIREARRAYVEGDLRARLAPYHADVDSAFFGWNDIWLAPEFRNWSLRDLLPAIRCPVLAVQGLQDQHGTMAQVDGIAAALPQEQCTLLKLAHCEHSVHKDQPEAVIEAVRTFLEA